MIDWSQWLYCSLLALALYTGQPKPFVAFAMCFDLAGTVLFAADPVAVATVDMMAIALLIGEGRRANTIAALFVAMQPLYVLHAFGLQLWAVYALVDCVAYLQLFILGRGDVGLVRLCRAALGYLRGRDRAVVSGRNAAFSLGSGQGVVEGEGVDGR